MLGSLRENKPMHPRVTPPPEPTPRPVALPAVPLGPRVLDVLGLSYRAQRNANSSVQWPWFEMFASGAAFLVWAFSLPSTPLRDLPWYDYGAWNSFVILVGSIGISGAPGGDKDAACAQVGIDEIAKALGG